MSLTELVGRTDRDQPIYLTDIPQQKSTFTVPDHYSQRVLLPASLTVSYLDWAQFAITCFATSVRQWESSKTTLFKFNKKDRQFLVSSAYWWHCRQKHLTVSGSSGTYTLNMKRTKIQHSGSLLRKSKCFFCTSWRFMLKSVSKTHQNE